ncbi:MAG: spore protein [Clostridiales bacterium GWF2_38_85]|nr:MAG: spore protein [Clostridiales bacterium GWF2_38_85]HBL85332.1 acid-soluble spore protein [Clostridiales bacterium]
MSRRNKNDFLYNLKVEAATELNLLQYIKENNDHSKADVSAKINGAQGGPIGGLMVKKMIAMQKKQLMEQQRD